MGGLIVHREPGEALLNEFPHVRPLFEQDDSVEYIQSLQGYDDDIGLEFSMHYREVRSEVAGIVVHTIEEEIVEVTQLPQMGEQWFAPRKSKLDVVR